MQIDWTQVLVALVYGLPATIIAIGTAINTVLTIRTRTELSTNTQITKQTPKIIAEVLKNGVSDIIADKTAASLSETLQTNTERIDRHAKNNRDHFEMLTKQIEELKAKKNQ